MLKAMFGRRWSRSAQVLRLARVQSVVLLTTAVLLPSMIFMLLFPGGWIPFGVWNSMLGAAVAIIIALALFKRFIEFPGIRSFGYILPTFSGGYGAVFAVLLLTRINYSNVYLLMSSLAALVTMFLLVHCVESFDVRRFYVAPAGKTQAIYQVPHVEWVLLDEPTLPPERRAAIVADLHHDHAPDWERMFADAVLAGHPVYHTKQLLESLSGRVTIEHLSENSFGSLVPNHTYHKVKRVADLAICLLMGPILIVVAVLIGLIVRWDSKGPALFRQDRIGYRGDRFTMFKFRTMHPRLEQGDAAAARADAMTQSMDDRITRIGRLLRRTRLDEIPQMVNVLRGEMSIIGPRPEALSLSQWYAAEIPFYSYRHIVRPGITGWAQVQQGHVTDLNSISKKLSYDFYYIRSFSAWLDIVIALRTVSVMLSGFGSK